MRKEIVKCISCGAVSVTDANNPVCMSCDDSDLHADIVGQRVEVSCLANDEKLLEWCEDNTYEGVVVRADHNSELLKLKGFRREVSVRDLL